MQQRERDAKVTRVQRMMRNTVPLYCYEHRSDTRVQDVTCWFRKDRTKNPRNERLLKHVQLLIDDVLVPESNDLRQKKTDAMEEVSWDARQNLRPMQLLSN